MEAEAREGKMGRVGIVSPLSAVPGCRLHCEEGRGRGAVSIFLLIPEEPPGALSRALEMVHDPRGPADLDQRLGQLAAVSPPGTAFLVSLDQHVWVYPSTLAKIRLVKEHGIVETLGVPQVVRLLDGQRIEVIATATGEAIALAGHSMPTEEAAAPPPVRARRRMKWPLAGMPVAHPRLAAIAGGAVALAIFVIFRIFSQSSVDGASAAADSERLDAYVQPDLESKVLETIADPAKRSPDRDDAASAQKPAQREWSFDSRAAITSSPLVVGGLVVFGSRDSTLYCLDAESGQTKWSYPAGSGIGSSPRASRNLVVVGTYSGRVLAVDLKSGELEWEGRTGGRIAANPCLVEDLVIIGSNDSRVHAFNLTSGDKVWTFATRGAVRATAEPVASDRVVVGSTDGTLYCLDTKNGRAVWKRTAPSGILAGAAYEESTNRVVVGAKDGTVLCLDAKSGEMIWRVHLGSSVNGRPCISEKTALVGTERGELHALDVATGKSRWSVTGRGGFNATPLVVGKTVIAPAYDGTLHYVSLGDGTLKEKRSLGSKVWSSPAGGKEVLYVGTFDGKLLALALP